MSQELDYSELTARTEKLIDAAKSLKPLKLDILDRVGAQMQGEVQSRIGGTGKVQSWQEVYRGSGGGYAAVRARAKTFDRSYAVGYITNAIENGHRIRSPSGRAKHYKPRIKQPGKVRGLGFYADSRAATESLANAAGAELAEAIARAMEE